MSLPKLVINEVERSSPQALQAVKLLAQYLGKKLDKVSHYTMLVHAGLSWRHSAEIGVMQEQVVSTLAEWLSDPVTSNNATTLLVAGIVYVNEENYVEALKACHTGLSLEMCVTVLRSARRIHLSLTVHFTTIAHMQAGFVCANVSED